MATIEGGARTRQKWGTEAADAGFTVIPNHLLAINQFVTDELQITPTEMVVLLQILSSWWEAEKLPFPSKATIAKRLGLSPRQVQRALASLEDKRYLRRIARFTEGQGRASNVYDVSGLVVAVSGAAKATPNAFRGRRAVDAE